jgi:site-specific DNA-cytosine methylase
MILDKEIFIGLCGRNIVDGKRCDIKGAKTGLYKIDLQDGEYYFRKLTPVECERLQGFPDFFTNGISTTQRYKVLGNSFTVPVIEYILKQIFTL